VDAVALNFVVEGDAEAMVETPETTLETNGRNPQGANGGVSNTTAMGDNDCGDCLHMMEAVVERGNMTAAYKRVVGNKGAAGTDGMSVDELQPYLDKHWERIKSELLEDRYTPSPVLKIEIPKPNGGIRNLGIPVVVDRLIGQGLYQVMKPQFEPGFSVNSYGFIEGRSAHQAIIKARAYVIEGRRWVVDIDLEKFFDRVNHDILMARIARKVKDKRVLRLIRRYLQAGVMIDGVETQRHEGTPQGSPLSPLLSNILLDDLDKELEKRGHKFVRYADDCNIYVKSEAAATRVMASITGFLAKRLRLKVNTEKSKIDHPWNVKFLGYSVTMKDARLKVAPESVQRLKGSLQEILRCSRGVSVQKMIEESNKKLRGWANYFKLAEVERVFKDLDGWIRRRIRCVLWRQWKRVYRRATNLINQGISEKQAWKAANNGRGPWFNANTRQMKEAFPNTYFEQIGLVSLFSSIVVKNP
jgi:RNA-directed DNA polymerase